jgi:hypothetical protein
VLLSKLLSKCFWSIIKPERISIAGIVLLTALIVLRVKDSNTIAGAKKDLYTITKIYIL